MPEPLPPSSSRSAVLRDERAFRQTLRRASFGLALALALPALALLGMVLYLLWTARSLDHTDRIIAQTQAVEKLAVDMAIGLRGFQLTGDERFLESYRQAAPRVEKELAALSELVADNPSQSALAISSREDIARWRGFAERTLTLQRAGAPDIRDAEYNLGGKTLMDAARAGIAGMVGEEIRLRAIRDRRLGHVIVGLFTLLGVGAVAVIPVLSVWLGRLRRTVTGSYRASLAASEERAGELQVTLNSIGDAVIATDAAGAVVLLNPAAERLTGWSAAEARGRALPQVFPIFHEQTGAPAENPVERVLRERIVVGLANHTVLRPRGGGEVPIEDSAAPIFTESGRLRGVILVFHDVTEKRARERAQLASEAQARAILDTSLDAVLLMDASGKIAAWNPAAERIFGWSREEVMGADLAAHIIPERMREAHRRGLGRFLATGEGPVLARRLELPALRRDGTEFPVELSINPLPGADPAMFVGVARDITERKAAEAGLAESARLFALRAEVAARLTSEAPIDGNLQGCCELLVRHLDAAFARIWTLPAGESVLTLRASAGLYTHLDGPHARVPLGEFKIGRIAQNRQPHLTNDVQHDPNISDPEWARREGMIAFAGYPLIGEGKVVGVLALFARHAISAAALSDLAPLAESIARCIERKGAEEALRAAKEQAEAASRSKDNFLAALSHELRTPLTPVLMTAAALREDPRLPADAREQLGMMERNIALEARLIDDLLDLTRITRGKLSLRLQPCDAHSLISLAVEIVRDEAQAKGIAIERSFAAPHSGLVADPARFQQVIWNLLRNAVKFTPRGGHIAIRTANAPREGGAERLQIEIRDSGVGIEPEALDRIFQAFEQAGRANDHRFGGLGLGLAIARAIVDLHGGTIRAESAGAGRGATFTIELPDAMEPPHGIESSHHAGAAPGSAATAGTGSLRLLLVEDHGATLEVLTRLLSREGHHVVAAATVGAALAAAEKEEFDAVVSDLGLPDGTGTELMVQLRERHGLRGIALSGYGMEEDLERTREAGFIAHLIKPVDFNQLRRALETLD